jgi:glycosyltransferase involved in cell wall biosynthesis
MNSQTKKTFWLITLADKANAFHSGIVNKAYAQKEALSRLGFETELFFLEGNNIIDKEEKVLKKIKAPSLRSSFFYFLKSHILNVKILPDVLYIRYPFTTLSFLRFLSNVRKNYKTCKVVIEFPTYPYKKEFRGWKKINYYYEQFFFTLAKKYIDLAVVIGNRQEISDVKTIFLTNGISVPEDLPVNIPDKNVFQMLALGNWNDWHGIDRVLNGLENYYKNKPQKKVIIHVFGEGKGLHKIKTLVKTKLLEEYVRFYGKKEEIEIDRICSFCNIGIGVLGIHRKGLNLQSPLKHRYYISRGIPLFFSTPDVDLSENLPFVHMCDENDSPVSILEIIEFTERIQVNSDEIWQYAREYLSWESRFKEIMKALQNG